MSAISRSSVLSAAWAIVKANPAISFGAAQSMAWKSAKLKAALRIGVVNFSFLKADGSVRKAAGTLAPELVNYIPTGTGAAESPLVVRFYDVEINEFRSLRIDRLIAA